MQVAAAAVATYGQPVHTAEDLVVIVHQSVQQQVQQIPAAAVAVAVLAVVEAMARQAEVVS